MNKLLVVKNNELIENFIFNATTSELQILNHAVSTLNPRWDNDGAIFRLNIPELVKIFNVNSNKAYEHYRQALKRLMKREYGYEDAENITHVENLVVRVSRKKNDNSWLEFKFNTYVSKRLSNLNNFFTAYDIKHISMFKSKYAIMLYEIFKMKLGQKLTTIDKLKKYSQCISIESFRENLSLSTKYLVFAELIRRVLTPAKDNINKHSDINLDYQIIKTGRTPTHIKFTAKYKKGKQPNLEAKQNVIEHQASLPLQETTQSNQIGFTEEHKETAKKYLDDLKKINGMK